MRWDEMVKQAENWGAADDLDAATLKAEVFSLKFSRF